MCKYCDETLYRYERKKFVMEEEMYESIDKKFCAECGTLLVEVKPLTVEQLTEYEGKPIWIKDLSQTADVKNNHWSIVHSVNKIENTIVFMGGGNGKGLVDYTVSWVAYSHEPKE